MISACVHGNGSEGSLHEYCTYTVLSEAIPVPITHLQE